MPDKLLARMAMRCLTPCHGGKAWNWRWWQRSLYGSFIVLALAGCITTSVMHGSGPGQYLRAALQGQRLVAMWTFMCHGDAQLDAFWRQKQQVTQEHLAWGSYDLTTDIHPTSLDLGIWSGYRNEIEVTYWGFYVEPQPLYAGNAK